MGKSLIFVFTKEHQKKGTVRLLHLQFYPFQDLKLVLTLHKLEVKVKSFPSPQCTVVIFLFFMQNKPTAAFLLLGACVWMGAWPAPPTLCLLALEVTLQSANQIERQVLLSLALSGAELMIMMHEVYSTGRFICRAKMRCTFLEALANSGQSCQTTLIA